MRARTKISLVFLLVSFFSSFSFASTCSEVLSQNKLPAYIHIKTPTQTFTHRWYIALEKGRIWIKPNPQTTGIEEPWFLLPSDGKPHLPFEWVHPLHEEPYITEVSADGENLIAIDQYGLVYYAKLFNQKRWHSRWGLPFGSKLKAPDSAVSIAMSHRGKFNEYYEDIDGNKHPISAGVTTLYALIRTKAQNGKFYNKIFYADPWLNHGFHHEISTPQRGTFNPIALSASASQVFVIDEGGRMYTRLVDYDTDGDNPVLPYTYHRGVPQKGFWKKRVLPGHGWRSQPPIVGQITSNITILQTGKGNSARELRVEGIKVIDGIPHKGYYYKGISEFDWKFKETGYLHSTSFLNNDVVAPAVDLAPCCDRGFISYIKLKDNKVMPIEIRKLNPYVTPAYIRLWVGNNPIDLTLHIRRPKVSADGATVQLQGTIEIPKAVLLDLFDGQQLVHVKLNISGNQLTFTKPWFSSLPLYFNEIQTTH